MECRVRCAWITDRSSSLYHYEDCVTAKASIPLTSSQGNRGRTGLPRDFHSRLRNEFLSGEVFGSIFEAQMRMGIWRRDYNEERLHSSLGYVTPREFAARWAEEAANRSETKATHGS